jgi:hypothetical protein
MLTAALSLPLFALGCSSGPTPDQAVPAEDPLFAASSMRIHPIFSGVKDWTGDGKPDGFEVLLEFQDRFGDPTKAAGNPALFELFDYRQANADPRGQRLATWRGSIATLDEQRVSWNRTSRTYTFQLAFPQVSTSKSYVLNATFQIAAGKRFFDRIVLAAEEEPTPGATTKPTTQPSE